MDAFISHSSANVEDARTIEKGLEKRGLDVWLDDSEMRRGVVLTDKLQASIRDARAVVLLWSGPASRSRWVATEWLMAVHLGRFIVPIAVDATKLPQCMEQIVYLREPVTAKTIERLADDVRDAPSEPSRLTPMLAAQSPELYKAIGTIALAQGEILDQIGKWKIEDARKRQAKLTPKVRAALKRWRLDPRLQNVSAYHLKNAYMLCHWDAIQAGQGPKDDPVLKRAERRFLGTLAIDPWDPEAVNGLGSILMFRRNLAAAEFFVTAAIEEAKRRGWEYPAAEEDLELVHRYQRP
jgi:TIR domain